MAQWEQVDAPDGYDSPAVGSGEYVVAPKRDGLGATWHVLKRDDSGQLSELPGAGVWRQTRMPSEMSRDDVEQAVGWAQTQIDKLDR
jgi:hypothetical protein